jgi:hypothetical protein
VITVVHPHSRPRRACGRRCRLLRVLAQSQKKDQKLDPAVLSDAPNVPQMVVDSDGTLHFGPRTVPLPALASSEARRAYTRQMLQRGQSSAARGGLASVRITETNAAMPMTAGGSKEAALKIYPVVEESQRIGGVGVTIYSSKTISSQNRNKVAMEFEMDAEAIAVASLGQLKVIKVNYRAAAGLRFRAMKTSSRSIANC